MLFDVFVKISKNTKNEYEHDKEAGGLRMKGTLNIASPGDYGIILNAHSVEGLGCIVLSDEAALPGSVLKVRPIGSLVIEFKGVVDNEVIAVPEDSEIKDIKNLTKKKLDEVARFIEYFKGKEFGPEAKVKRVDDSSKAEKMVGSALEMYKKLRL